MLSLETLTAYCRTSYRADFPGGPFVLRVGSSHPDVDAALEAMGFDRWAFLTGWNPRSTVLPDDENAARHRRLIERVAALALPAWPGEGFGDSPGWVPEVSLFIAEVDAEQATSLGREFDQHAVVTGTRGEPAELRFPFWPEVERALERGVDSADPVVAWTARRALSRPPPAGRSPAPSTA